MVVTAERVAIERVLAALCVRWVVNPLSSERRELAYKDTLCVGSIQDEPWLEGEPCVEATVYSKASRLFPSGCWDMAKQWVEEVVLG